MTDKRRPITELTTWVVWDDTNKDVPVTPILGTGCEISDRELALLIQFSRHQDEYVAFVELWERRTEMERMRSTLVNAGYTDCGGELWKPPLGQPPAWLNVTDAVFKECDACQAKPGSPVLCRGCAHNRTVIAKLLDLVPREQQPPSSNVLLRWLCPECSAVNGVDWKVCHGCWRCIRVEENIMRLMHQYSLWCNCDDCATRRGEAMAHHLGTHR